jgi:hypothetical protein
MSEKDIKLPPLKPPFEEEFPDEADWVDEHAQARYELGQISAAQAIKRPVNELSSSEFDEIADQKNQDRKTKKKKARRAPRLSGRAATVADSNQYKPAIEYDGNHNPPRR